MSNRYHGRSEYDDELLPLEGKENRSSTRRCLGVLRVSRGRCFRVRLRCGVLHMFAAAIARYHNPNYQKCRHNSPK